VWLELRVSAAVKWRGDEMSGTDLRREGSSTPKIIKQASQHHEARIQCRHLYGKCFEYPLQILSQKFREVAQSWTWFCSSFSTISPEVVNGRFVVFFLILYKVKKITDPSESREERQALRTAQRIEFASALSTSSFPAAARLGGSVLHLLQQRIFCPLYSTNT